MKPYLSIVQQVPEFVRSEYPAFVEFLKAYYQWLEEEYNIGRLEELVDIDSTTDGFLKYFRKQLDIHGITANTSNRNYLQHIKELYTAKGSEASFEFLFKILYDKPSSVIYPWDYVFKPSEGVWTQDTSFLVKVTTGDYNHILSSSVVVTDVTGRQYKTYVRDINIRPNGLVEVFIKRFDFFEKLETLSSLDGLFSSEIQSTTTKAKVIQGGAGFKVGQVFSANTQAGQGTLIKVKSVDKAGAIKVVEIIKFGTGYAANFNVVLSAYGTPDLTQLGSQITLNLDVDANGSVDATSTYQTDDYTDSQNETGLIVKHDYTNFSTAYMVDPTYVGELVGEIDSNASAIYKSDRPYAIIRMIVGDLCIYPGYYQNSTNILGDLVYFEDSYYYQAFSYVTVIEENLEHYASLLRKVLHPAGTKHFGIMEVSNAYQLQVQTDPALNLIAKADALRDFVTMVEQLSFAVETAWSDTLTVTDLISTVAQYIRGTADGFADSATATDFSYRHAKPVVIDVVSMTDLFTAVPGIGTLDLVTTSQLLSFDVDKYLSNSVQTTNAGGVWGNPYTEVDPTYYWTPGYLENERNISN